MSTDPSPRPSLGRCLLSRPELRASAAPALVLVAVVAVGAWLDPSGLLAPVSGRGLPLVGLGGAYGWTAFAVGVPVLLAATVVPVFLTARAGRPRVGAGWVFLVTWAAVVGAAALAAAAAGLASVVPLLGPHLSAGLAVRFAVATSGFAALKFLLLGPLVAGAAALAYRFGPARSTPTEGQPRAGSGVALVVMFVVVALAAVSFAAPWWRGGPVGYAFAGPLVAPTAAAGPLGFLAGLIAFLGLFYATLRVAQRRLAGESGPWTVAATVWVAAIVAGLGLGALDAVVAALPFSAPVEHAGPDSWWIATTLISLATGVSYGVAVGAIGAAVAGAAGRLGPMLRRAAHPAWRVAGVAGALVLGLLPTLIGAPGPAGPPTNEPAAAPGLPRLTLVPARAAGGLPVIGDVTGRQVILRGVNMNQLIEYYLRDPAIPATQSPTDTDFARMASMGFNVVRLGMSWSRLEPRRGVFDVAYLNQIRAAVAAAKAHGIYTVLDLHQDAWGNALARPSQECDGGTTPTTGWDGAPTWATITDGTLHCQFLARDLAPAVSTAYSNFYTDRDGIQTELVRTWAFVARAFANEPAVAGFDLLNEPGIGANPPTSSGLLLGRYYDAAITAIREAERAGQGDAHLIFFEPSVLWSGLAFDVTPPPGFTDDRLLVFAPHPYSESITMDQSFGLTIASIERNLTVSTRAAASYGAALWTGEWGWFGDPSADSAKVRRFIDAQNRLGIGGAFWVWRQGCGSPETDPEATASGNLIRVSCTTADVLGSPTAFAEPLSAAYPRALPGRLDTLVSGTGGRELTLTGVADADSGNCAIDIWVPGDPAPQVTTDGVTDAKAEKVSGGWRVTGCGRGEYRVAITA